MEDYNIIRLSSPPSSLQENFMSPGNYNGRSQHIRKNFMSSTPKHEQNGFPSNLSRASSSSSVHSRKSRNRIGLTSDHSFDIALGSTNDSDLSDEDLSETNLIASKLKAIKYASHSLPVTPRLNGKPLSLTNGSSTLGHITVSPYLSSRPHDQSTCSSTMNLSSSASHYATCQSSLLGEANSAISSSIDYSSLPLPKEDAVALPNRRHISRYLSEPAITSNGSMHRPNSSQKRSSFKQNRRDSTRLREGTSVETSSESNLRSTCSGIEDKLDDLEMMGTQWKFIRTLVTELNKCRAQNSSAAIELHQTKLELQVLRSGLESYSEANVQPGAIAEMVVEMHAAQRVRDEAMMSRIKLANEERDAALTQTQSLLKKLQSHTECQQKGDENLLSLEDDLKALRLAINLQEGKVQDAPIHKNSGMSIDVVKDLKEKLSRSELNRTTLQEKYDRLENVLSSLQHGVGLMDGKSVEVSRIPRDSTPHESSSEGDPKNSLSSLESLETMSASSWKNMRTCQPVRSVEGTEIIEKRRSPSLDFSFGCPITEL